LDKELIGITKFCIHPAKNIKQTQKVGGTKQLDINKIKALNPDLIIANKEENERGQVEELMNICPVWVSDISDLTGAINMIESVGQLVGKGFEAKILANKINQQFNQLITQPCSLRTVYFIWRKPYMIAGKDTFIYSMLKKCGLINAFDQERYPEIDAESLKTANPAIILLSSEPYPFIAKHIAELKAIVPNAIIKLVDGEMFSWYGSRLLYAPAYFQNLLAELKSAGAIFSK
jgi:ABC-type Fe3+-hydroxamate transport system substrate-binding protein